MFQQDFVQFPTNVLKETQEGYLTGNINVTGAGVFHYLGDDHKFVGRLRSVEEVKKATASINCKPVTLQHPNQPVTLDNIDELSVGMSANDASFDGLNNHVTITVTSPKAIKAIKDGAVKAISMGYRCSVVQNDGVWQGSKHKQEQKDIVYNHIALVREGRAGDQVKFCVGDAAEAEDIFDISETDYSPVDPKKGESAHFENDNKQKQEQSNMKTIQLDGVDYQADEKVIEALQAAQDDASTKLDEIHTLLDGIDERDSRIADLEEQLSTANDEIDESVIDAAVNAKIAIMDAARAAGIECSSDDDVSDLKRGVIKAAFDNIDIDAIEDEASINALFNSARSVIESANDGADGEGSPRNANPAAQYDGVGRHEETLGDSAEDRLWKKTHDISIGKEVK